MTAKEENITIQKTARYVTLGNTKNAKNIWFVFHGYGQLANYFIRNFAHLDPDENYIVAPEGFYRFYLEGFSGRVGATWMTKESRLTDIDDYVAFIDSVFEKTIRPFQNSETNVIALGFSQGVATVARWVTYGHFRPDRLILWAGTFPPDLEPVKAEQSFSSIPTACCIGDSDPFATPDQLIATKKELAALDIDAKFFTYKGEHKIPADEFDRICEQFIS